MSCTPTTMQAGYRREFRRRALHRLTTLAVTLAITVALQSVSLQQLRAQSNQRPNIVVIMADDKSEQSAGGWSKHAEN